MFNLHFTWPINSIWHSWSIPSPWNIFFTSLSGHHTLLVFLVFLLPHWPFPFNWLCFSSPWLLPRDSSASGCNSLGFSLFFWMISASLMALNTIYMFSCTDVSLETKAKIIHTLVFPITMYECESWTVEGGWKLKNDSLESWCWRDLYGNPGPTERWISSY